MDYGKRWFRRILLAFACVTVLGASSCESGIEKVVTLTFSDQNPEVVTISTSTQLRGVKEGTAEAVAVERERQALLSGSDEWTMRFASADPELERITFEHERKQLQRVEHVGQVPVSRLQRFFFDTPLTVSVAHGEGWEELTVYAGASTRASRQQKDRVEKLMTTFSQHTVRYFAATRAVYGYLRDNEHRAEPLFLHLGAALMGDPKNPVDLPELTDDETALVAVLAESIEALLDSQQGDAGAVDRELDAAFNPFPAEFRVVVPGQPYAVEGFGETKEGALFVKPVSVLDAITLLEGRWVSPDPMAALMRAGESAAATESFARAMANDERKASGAVAAGEVRDALVEIMKPARTFRVRWIRRAV